jgi:general secretion pathway protein A
MKINDYFNLKYSPFSNNVSTLYESKDYLETKRRLEYFLDEEGIALITGSNGVGKSQCVLSNIDTNKYKVIYIQNNDLTLFEFFNYLGNKLDIQTSHCHMSIILADIQKQISSYYKANKKVVIIIDGVESLQSKIIESLKYLCYSRFNDYKTNIILIGHTSFRVRIKRESFKTIESNIITNYDFLGLSLNETRDYIKHRLDLAGGDINLIDDKYYNAIYSYSDGNPMRINKYMYNLLLLLYSLKTKEVTSKLLKAVQDEVEI